MRFEIPPSFSGTVEQQITQMRSFLFRLIERLNIQGTGETAVQTDTTFTAKAYTELRDMIGTNAETARKLGTDKVSHTELVAELEDALRKAEQSGDFDGNGISSVTSNDDSSLTFGFTDGTFFQTPPLKGDPAELEVGDVFTTTREGDPAELLGYGTWEQIASSPTLMYKRTA